MLRIYLAGEVAVENGEQLLREADLAGRQGRLALVYLVAERERAVTQSELAELLWPDSLPPSWPVALSAVISKLRQRLGSIGLDRDRSIANAFRCYQFRPPGEAWIDEPKTMDSARGPVHIAGRVLPGVWGLERLVAWQLSDSLGKPASAEVVARAAETLLCNPAFQRATTNSHIGPK